MPSQLVKCAFGFRSFNDPKTKCVPLSVELGSEQGARVPGSPTRCPFIIVNFIIVKNTCVSHNNSCAGKLMGRRLHFIIVKFHYYCQIALL